MVLSLRASHCLGAFRFMPQAHCFGLLTAFLLLLLMLGYCAPAFRLLPSLNTSTQTAHCRFPSFLSAHFHCTTTTRPMFFYNLTQAHRHAGICACFCLGFFFPLRLINFLASPKNNREDVLVNMQRRAFLSSSSTPKHKNDNAGWGHPMTFDSVVAPKNYSVSRELLRKVDSLKKQIRT